jgi:calcineurin-like phosphoesterase family protein
LKYWFTADLHLGHSNIIKYCNRPFKDVHEMNEVLITNWNHRVRPGDQVFHVGDFCFKNSAGGKAGEGMLHKSSHYAAKLNGDIVYIKGNHDKNNSVRTIIDRVVIKYGPHYVNLVHVPEHYDANFAINFVGHVHEKWRYRRIYIPHLDRNVDLINVGVDQWDFKPQTFEELFNGYRVWAKTQSKRPKEGTNAETIK